MYSVFLGSLSPNPKFCCRAQCRTSSQAAYLSERALKLCLTTPLLLCQISFIALTSLFLLLGKFVAARHVQGHVVVLLVIGALGAKELLLLAVKITRWFNRLENKYLATQL